MSPTPTILTEIKNPKGRVFRRLYVKRRLATTGLFETSWQEITKDVKKWGTISKSIDAVRYSKVAFSDVNITMANDQGRYNPEDNDNSFWFGYANQQRTLVRIDAGFTFQTLGSNRIWTNTTFPASPTIFVGIIQGDINLSDKNEVSFVLKPLVNVFREFPTKNLTGHTTTGMTGSQFITMLRDQTDGSSNYIFRPFFQDTTTNWDYTSSSTVYVDITATITSARTIPAGAQVPQNDYIQMNVWDALAKLGEAEDHVPYVTREGIFKFKNRDENTSTAAFEFYGRNFIDRDYGITIKGIQKYGRKISDFYSRVEVKWLDSATTTAIQVTETALVVNATNLAWNYGQRTYKVENYWIGTITSAQSIAQRIYENVSAITNQLEFTTSFIPQLELLDKVELNYISSELGVAYRWDAYNWGEDTVTTDLFWSVEIGDAIDFDAKEFKLMQISINLDSLECKFVANEI